MLRVLDLLRGFWLALVPFRDGFDAVSSSDMYLSL